jgi:hypothetical protein
MGLDQYAHGVMRGLSGEEKKDELSYWRKHPNLQGWMELKYREKGGSGEFNCVEVSLTESDLNELECAVEARELPETFGFFFGEDDSEYFIDHDLEFIRKARKALRDGCEVVYSSWW